MGEVLLGGNAKQTGEAGLLTPEQLKYITGIIGGAGGAQGIGGAYGNLINGFSEENFQKSVVDPTMKEYNQQVLPGIEQRFTDANAGSSSALNQALVQSSNDVTNLLAGKRIDYQQMAGNQSLTALGQILQLLSQRQIDPIVQGPTSGLLKEGIQAGSNAAAAYAASSRDIKENIRDCKLGLDEVRKMEVKQYDFKVPVEGKQKDRIGVISEDMPIHLTADINGIKCVDIYGLVSVLVTCVKELDSHVRSLEERCQSFLTA